MQVPVTTTVAWKGQALELYVRPWKKSDDSVIREVLTRRVYEKRKVKLATSSVWLDGGAHIGTFALAAASEGCRVICYEPHPENFELLGANVERNGFAAVVDCHQAALLPEAGEATLHLAPRSTSFHSVMRPFRSGQSAVVRADGLAAVLEAHPEVDGLKLDVEGAEMPLLEALVARPELLARLKQLCWEWSFQHDGRTARLRAVIAALEAQGFVVRTHRQVFERETWTAWPSGVLVYASRPPSGAAAAASSSSST